MAVTVTRTSTLFTDSDGDNVADPGDIVLVHILVQNTNATDIVNLKVYDTQNGLTITDLNSVMVTPIAFDDNSPAAPLTIVGNTPYIVSASALLGNDIDPDGLEAGLTISSFANLNHVTVTAVAGGYQIVPETGYQGVASFDYFIMDEDGLTSVSAGRVHIKIEGQIWYVDSGAAPGGDGSYLNPFTDLTKLNDDGTGAAGTFGPNDSVKGDDDVDGANDTIFVYNRGTAYTGGITLESGQKLYGDGHDPLEVNGLTIGASSANSTINYSTYGVALDGGNIVKGVSLNGTATGAVAIRDGGATVGSLTVDKVSVSGQGQIIDIDQGGSINVTLASASSSGSTGGNGGVINLAGTGGSFTVAGGLTINGSHVQTGIDITGNTSLAAAFNGPTVVNTGSQHAVVLGPNITSSASFTGGLDIDTTSGTGLSFSSTALTIAAHANGNTIATGTGAILAGIGAVGAGGLDFDSLSATGTTTISAISLTLVSGGPINSDSTTIAGSALHGVSIFSTSSNVTLGSGSIGNSTSSSGRNVLIDGGNGSFDYNGNLTRSTDGNVIEVKNKTGGTVQFDGTVTTSSLGDGIVLTSNTGSTINFTNTLTLNTSGSGSTGFTATGGGTVSASALNSTINSGAGTALNVVNTNIGAGDLNFLSVSANGSTNGIVLNNTGSAGGLTITGSGTTNGSGGTIQNTSGRGIDIQNAVQIKLSNMTLTNAGNSDLDNALGGLSLGDNLDTNAGIHLVNVTNVTLDNIDITGGTQQGINGHNVANFHLLNSTITNAGDEADEDNIHFYNMSGTSSIVNTILTHTAGGGDDNFNLQMQSGNLDLTITGGSANGSGVLANNQGSGYLFGIRGTATANINMDDVKSLNHFSGGIVADAFDNSTMNLRVVNSTSSGNNDQLSVSAGDNSKVDLEVTNNILSSVATADFGVIGLLGSAFDTGYVFDARISNNNITVAAGLPTDGIIVNNAGGGTMNVAITNNTNFNYDGTQRAILIQGGQDGPGTLRATVTGNTITSTAVLANDDPRILVQASVTNAEHLNSQPAPTSSGNNFSMDLNIGGAGALANTFVHVGTLTAGDIRVRQRFDGNFNLDGYAGGNMDTAAVVAYLNGRNNEISSATATADTTGSVSAGNVVADPNDGVGPGFTGTATPTFVTVTVSAGSVAEDGATNLTYTFTRSGNLANALVGNFSITGTATAGSDFAVVGATSFDNGTGLGTVTFAAGSATATITVDPTSDLAAEADESVVVDFGNSTTANGGFARAVITNNDGSMFMQMATPAPGEAAGDMPVQGQGAGTNAATGGKTGDSGAGSGSTGSVSQPPTAADDGILSQAELSAMVAAAIERWAAAGATAEQIAAMRAVEVRLTEMMGVQIGGASEGLIRIDNDAAGYGWFVDSTPGDDSEFTGSGTRLFAASGGAAAGRVDLLTVLVHELGHQIGLEDDYRVADGVDAMYGFMDVGERRLPAAGDAARADGQAPAHEAFLLSPVADIGTLPAGKSVDIQYKAVINSYSEQIIAPLSNNATAQGSNIPDAVSNTNVTTVDTLTLGDVVFLDANKNGLFDAGEGLAGVSVSLYADNGTLGWDSGDPQVGVSQLTGAGGLYSFAGLAPGDYIVVVNASSFASGQPLNGKVSVAGGADPDDNVNNDDNGIAGVAGLGLGIASQTITLDYNSEPDGTPDVDGDTDGDTNLSLDFGFVSVNSAPTSTNLQGDVATFTENLPEVAVDAGFNLTITDPDSANFGDGSLVVRVVNKVATEDQLFFSAAAGVGGPGSGYTASGGNLYYNGVLFATYTAGGVGVDRTVSFNSNATPAIVQGLMRGIYYNNANTIDPSTATRTIEYVLKDGDGTDGGLGTDTLTLTSTVNVVAVNDAPEGGAGNSDSTDSATTLVFNAADFNAGFSDPDGNAFAGIVISSLPASGKLKLNSVDIAAPATITLAQLSGGALTFVPDAGTAPSSVTFKYAVYDDGGVLNSGIDTDPTPGTFTVTVTVPNAAPVIDLNAGDPAVDNTASYTENAAAIVLSSILTVSDSDDTNIESATVSVGTGFKTNADLLTVGGALAGTDAPTGISWSYNGTTGVLTLTGSSTLANYETILRQVGFESTSNAPGTSRVVNWKVNDGSSDSAIAKTVITITEENDSPAGTTATTTATEDTFRVLAGSNFGFSDPDSGDSLSAVTITAVNGSGSLYYDADGTAGSGDPVAVSTFPQTYTAAELAAGKVLYKAPANANGNALATIHFQVIDSAGQPNSTDPVANILTINVSAVNDTPDLSQTSAINATEQTASALLTGITVSDADLDAKNSGNGDYAGSSLIVNGDPANSPNDSYSIDPPAGANFTVDGGALKAGGSIFATFSTSGNQLQINFTSAQTPATSALVDEVIQSIRYTNTSDDPPTLVQLVATFVDGSPGAGQGNGGTNFDSELITVNLTPVNDPPTVTAADTTVSGTEDTNLVFKSTNGNAITVADPDNASLTATLTVTSGTLKLFQTTGLTVSGDGTGTVILTGSAANINAALEGLIYRGNLNHEGSDTLGVKIDDGTAIDTENVAITLADDGFIDGDSGNNVLNGTPQPDIFRLYQGGDDTANGMESGDLFLFRATLNSQDAVNGGDGRDQIAIQGNYTGGNALTLGTGVINVESFVLIPGNNTSFGDPGTNSYSYHVTTVNENVAVGEVVTFDGAQLRAGENFTFRGAAETNGSYRVIGGLGVDDFVGGSQSDVFLFNNGAFGFNDVVNGGAGTARDQLALRGEYNFLIFGSGQLISIESLVLLSGYDTPQNTDFDYTLGMHDNNLAAGATMTVDAAQLRADEWFVFFGQNETNGFFRISGGAGNDQFLGGALADRIRGNGGNDNIFGNGGADELTGGAGNDRFAYSFTTQSTAAATDRITDFTSGDVIAVEGIDARSATLDDDAFTFIGSAAFTPGTAGQLRAYEVSGEPGHWFVEADVNGDAVADLVIEVYTTDLQPLDATDFTL